MDVYRAGDVYDFSKDPVLKAKLAMQAVIGRLS